MPRLLIATNNPGKLEEYRRLLDGCGWELVSPGELGLRLPDEEHGAGYAENAKIKALNGVRVSGLVTLADDSGLEIDALGGAPGMRSARFLGDDAGYDKRFAHILRELAELRPEQRGARFRCVIAVARPGSDEVVLCEGEVQGRIAPEPRGDRGFGYDPIFQVPDLFRTLAELPAEEKDALSHRGRAAALARPLLEELSREQGRSTETVRRRSHRGA